jgi:hypothetical protein
MMSFSRSARKEKSKKGAINTAIQQTNHQGNQKMSAYQVSEKHIAILVRAATSLLPHCHKKFTWGCGPGEFIEIQYETYQSEAESKAALMLASENAKSVAYRYKSNPSPVGVPSSWPELTWKPCPIKVLKAIKCYEYQSCEHPEWETSSAKRFCDRLRDVATEALPEYGDAKWDITEFSDCERTKNLKK